MLGVDAAAVAEMRDAALVRVASDIGLTGDGDLERARALLAARSTNGAAAEVASPPPRRRLWLLAAAVVVVLAIVLPLTLSSGGARRAAARPQRVVAATPFPPAPAPPPAPRTAALAKVPGAPRGARGSAGLSGNRLLLTVSGLPRRGPRSFAVWLVGTRSGHRALARFAGGSARLQIALPPGFGRYRWIDVVRVGRRFAPHAKAVLELRLSALPLA